MCECVNHFQVYSSVYQAHSDCCVNHQHHPSPELSHLAKATLPLAPHSPLPTALAAPALSL